MTTLGRLVVGVLGVLFPLPNLFPLAPIVRLPEPIVRDEFPTLRVGVDRFGTENKGLRLTLRLGTEREACPTFRENPLGTPRPETHG
jgi:hypothetical protein